MGCLTDSEANGLAQGRLSGADRRRLEEHIDQCADCRILVAEASKYLAEHDGLTAPREATPAPMDVRGDVAADLDAEGVIADRADGEKRHGLAETQP